MEPEQTEDAILGGRLRLRQPARGYRVNLDTVLLAAACNPQEGARVAEPGCGVGGALLAVAMRGAHVPRVRFVGIEREPVYAALAKDNVALNGLGPCVEIVEGDALDWPAPGVFDWVIVNPPYDGEGEGRPPAEGKRAAFVAEQPIEAWVKVWSNRLAAGGRLVMIHRAHKLPEILAALEGRLGGATAFPVRPFATAPASRVLVCARKGSRAPFRLLAGLNLHPRNGAEGKHTPETEAILRGEAGIEFA
jgi:tRNA1(Val) A37 N6-methylase TrmN6